MLFVYGRKQDGVRKGNLSFRLIIITKTQILKDTRSARESRTIYGFSKFEKSPFLEHERFVVVAELESKFFALWVR